MSIAPKSKGINRCTVTQRGCQFLFTFWNVESTIHVVVHSNVRHRCVIQGKLTRRAIQGTESLTQREDGTGSERFPKNGIYKGQQRSIIYGRQSGLADNIIDLCLRFFLSCRVQYHHEKECHQDRVRLFYTMSDGDYHQDIISRTVSDAANQLDNTYEYWISRDI